MGLGRKRNTPFRDIKNKMIVLALKEFQSNEIPPTEVQFQYLVFSPRADDLDRSTPLSNAHLSIRYDNTF